MTTDDTDELEPEDGPVKPQRMVLTDLAVLSAAFATNFFGAVVQLCEDTLEMTAAHANHRRKVVEDQKAVAEFRKQLSDIPETANV